MLTWDDIKNTSKENAWKMLYSAGQTLGTPIVKSLANIGALGATGWGAIQMARNKPESAERAFNKALTARQFAGTEGSFDQGIESGKNTLLRGTLSAGQTALTGLGLPYVTPGKLATAGVIGGGLNKVMGGEFSTGAGQAMGSLPQILGFVAKSNPILAKYLPKSSGVTNRILGSVGNVTQGVGMDLARGMPTTPTSMAIDAITGAMGGTSQFDTPKVSKTGIVGDQSIKPEEVKPIIKGFRLKTDAPAYDALLDETKTAANGKPLKQYYAEEKGQIGKIEYLTPDEYLKRTAKGFNKSVEELIQGRGDKYAEQYAEQMKNGIEFDMPYLDYSHKRFNQEGVNRAMAAKLAGIEKIPTLIVEDTPKNYVYKSINPEESKEVQTPKVGKNSIILPITPEEMYKKGENILNFGEMGIHNLSRNLMSFDEGKTWQKYNDNLWYEHQEDFYKKQKLINNERRRELRIYEKSLENDPEKSFRLKILKHIYDSEFTPKGEAAEFMKYIKLDDVNFKHKELKPEDIPDWAIKKSQDAIKDDYITLYHGSLNLNKENGIIKAGSWSADPEIAALFTYRWRQPNLGQVMKIRIPKNKILLHYKAFPDLAEEKEVLVGDLKIRNGEVVND